MIGEYFTTIQISIGEKLGNMCMCAAAFVTGMIIGFVYGPVFAIICFAYYPIMFLFVALFGVAVKKATIAKIVLMKEMGGTVEE